MPPTIQTSRDNPTEPPSCWRTRLGVRKIPEPITEPMKRNKRSVRRRVRRSGGIDDGICTPANEATKHDNRSWFPAHSQNTYAEVRRCEHRQNQTSVCHDANNGGNSLEFLEVDDGRGHETQQKY